MIFGTKKLLEDSVVELLGRSPMTGPELITAIQKERPGAAAGPIYRVLRELQQTEVVLKDGKKFALNRYWLQKLRALVEQHTDPTQALDREHILSLEDGDRVTYQFKNPYLLDIYWGHLFDLVFNAHSTGEPILIYHPHEWLAIARPESERLFLDRFTQDQKLALISIGGATDLDKAFKQKWSDTYRKINTGITYHLKPTQYLNIVGDYIFEMRTSAGFAEHIDAFFNNHTSVTPEAQRELVQLSQKQSRSKLIFERNRKKARVWQKRISKDFYIPHEFRKHA